MKRVLSFLLCVLFLTSLVACTPTQNPTPTSTNPPEQPPAKLSTPTGLSISANGVISWSAVENATSYEVTIGDNAYTTTSTTFTAPNTNIDFRYSVKALAEGFESSEPTAVNTFTAVRKPPVNVVDPISVAILGSSEVKGGHSITLTAKVSGTSDQAVLWEVVEGQDYASVDAISGKLTASEVDADKIIKIQAKSLQDDSAIGTKAITVLSTPELTQEMLDALAEYSSLSFEGYVNISLYEFGLSESFYQSHTTNVSTSLNGVNWYAQYQDGSTGLSMNLYVKNHDGIACNVGVSFNNEETYTPVLDDNGEPISWTSAGYYNNFKGLKVSDFKFDKEIWRYVYVGNDKQFESRLIASANPYDFIPKMTALLLGEGEILGIYSIAEDDYSIVQGYRAVQELTVAINYGETVEVPTISKFSHDPIHDQLNEAIANMKKLSSYKLDFKETTASYLTTGYVTSGFSETITSDHCYFVPYSVSSTRIGEEIKVHAYNNAYGFKAINDSLYNAYYRDGDKFVASRAYDTNFSTAKPTFDFAGEIFTRYYEDKDEGTVTYYVNEVMCPVASTFYYGMGNDIALYGMFATPQYLSANGSESFTPYVVVKDGYIIESGFYFYIGSIFGIVEIHYSDFDTAAIPENTVVEFTPRQIPSSWNDVTISVSNDSSSTIDDEEKNAADVLKEFFKDEEILDKVPFFGTPLKDTYGFGLTTIHRPAGENRAYEAIVFYFDVPLDIDYTIQSSMDHFIDFLLEQGFTQSAKGIYTKDGICISPTDSGLDFMVYLWFNPNQ